MSAPTPPASSAAWATNTNYAAGSETGQPTKVVPVSGRIADGWSPETPPTPMHFNWWQNVVYLWIVYFQAAVAYLIGIFTSINTTTIKRNRIPPVIASAGSGGSGWVNAGSATGVSTPCIVATAGSSIAEGQIDLDVPDGYILKTLKFSANGAGGINFEIFQLGPPGWTPPITGSNPVGFDGGVASSVETDYSFNFQAETGPTSTGFSGFTAQASGGGGPSPRVTTFSRATGSFVTDGFVVGQTCDSSGWNLGENNWGGYKVTSVGALSLVCTEQSAGASVVGTVDTGTAARQVEATPIIGQGGVTIMLFENSSGTGGEAITMFRTELIPPPLAL